MDLHQSNLEESVIRRTVCVTGLGAAVSDEDVMKSFETFGEIQYVRVDLKSSGDEKVALIQYKDEHVVDELIRKVQIRALDGVCRVRPSSITIEVIPPTDAVFGKPMTVGRHVMAVNISKESRGRDAQLPQKVRRSHDAILSVLERISASSGWHISQSTIDSLRCEVGDNLPSDLPVERSRPISRRSSRSRSRSSRGMQRRTHDRYQSYRRRY